jgi:hypothetical protein
MELLLMMTAITSSTRRALRVAAPAGHRGKNIQARTSQQEEEGHSGERGRRPVLFAGNGDAASSGGTHGRATCGNSA